MEVYRRASNAAKNRPFRRKLAYKAAMQRRFYRVPLEQIGYVRAILEGYDGLAILSTPDPKRGEVELVIGEGLEEEAQSVLIRLEREARMIEIPRPQDWKIRS
jgi:hypothetical protein